MVFLGKESVVWRDGGAVQPVLRKSWLTMCQWETGRGGIRPRCQMPGGQRPIADRKPGSNDGEQPLMIGMMMMDDDGLHGGRAAWRRHQLLNQSASRQSAAECC